MYPRKPEESGTSKWKRLLTSLKCSREFGFKLLSSLLPVFSVLREYSRDKLLGDVMSGITVACLHFPQGLAYGLLASLSPLQGLYTSFFPVLFYTLFGTCQHMAFGTDSVIALFTAEVVETQVKAHEEKLRNAAANGTNGTSAFNLTGEELLAYKVTVATACTFVCGAILLVMGAFRLGFITTFQSTSFIGGFTTAAAFHIFTSQVPKALGIQIPLVKGIGKVVVMYKLIFERIHGSNLASVIIVVICVIFIMILKDFINVKYKHKLKVPIPADLLTIIIATVVSKFAHLYIFDVEMVGEIPSGIRAPKFPNAELFWPIFPKCIEMAVLIFFLSIAMVKVCTEKHEYEVNDNQELVGYGLTNIASSFFPCFPANTSPPRNMILSSMGAQTTLNGVFTSIVLLLVLYVLGQLFFALPVPALAAMIIVSVKPLLLQVKSLPTLYRRNVYDAVIWVSACLTGILLDLPYGLLVGIVTSLVVLVVHNQRAPAFTLVRSEQQLFVREMPESATNGVLIFKMCASLYFATAERFKRKIYTTTIHPLHVKNKRRASFEITFSQSRSDPSTIRSNNTHESGSFVCKRGRSDDQTIASVDNSQDNSVTSLTNSSNVNHSSLHMTVIDSDSSQASRAHVKVIIIDCSCMGYIDTQGINALLVVAEEYRRVGVAILFSGCTPSVWATLNRSDFFSIVSKERVFFQLIDAYEAAMSMLE